MSRRVLPWYEQVEVDELAHSLLARTAANNSIDDPKHALKLFCESSSAIPSIDLPARLDAIYRNVGAFSGFVSCEDMAYRTTLLPYHSAFMTEEQRSRALAIARSADGRGLKVYAGLVANGTSVGTLRACAECDRLSWETRGCRYWRRVHQLPGVTVCEIHDQPLLEVNPRLLQSSRQRLLTSQEATDDGLLQPISGHAPRAHAFAAASALLLKEFRGFDSPMRKMKLFLEGCRHRDWVRGQSQFRWDCIESALEQAVADFLPPTAMGLGSSPSVQSFRAIIQKPRTLVSPVKQLIFILATFGSISQLIDLQSTGDSPLAGQNDLMSANLSVRGANNAVAAGSNPGDGGGPSGIAGALRPKKIYSEVEDRIAARLARGISMHRIAAGERVSLSSVYRVLHKRHGLAIKRDEAIRERTRSSCQNAWLEALKTTESTSAARKAHAAAYAWLYRNDRAWLREQQTGRTVTGPRVARVDWTARDARLAEAIGALTEFDKRYYRVLGVLNVSDASLRRNRARLPLTWVALEALHHKAVG